MNQQNPKKVAQKSQLKKRLNKSSRPFYPAVVHRTLFFCRDIGGFPDTYKAILRYSYSGGLLGAGTGLTASAAYLINSPGGLSHLPKGWAQLKEVYNEFLVRRFTWIVNVRNLSATVPVRAFVLPVADAYVAALSSSVTQLSEADGVVSKPLGFSSSGHDVARFRSSATIEALAGLDKPVSTENDTYTGYTGSSNSTSSYLAPVNLFQLVIIVYSENGTNVATGGVGFSIDLDMEIEFYGKLPIY